MRVRVVWSDTQHICCDVIHGDGDVAAGSDDGSHSVFDGGDASGNDGGDDADDDCGQELHRHHLHRCSVTSSPSPA